MRVLAGVEVRPTEIVEQGTRPVGGCRFPLAEVEPALRPLLHRLAIVGHREGAHVCSVSGEVVLARVTRKRKRCFEERQGAFGIPTRPQLPAALEVDAHLRNGTRSGKSFRLLQQAIAGIEVIPQTLDSRKLRQDLRAPSVLWLVIQLRAKSLLGRLQIVEIPQGAQTVRHRANCTPEVAGLRTD